MRKVLSKISQKYSESTEKHPVLWMVGSFGVAAAIIGTPKVYGEVKGFKQRQIETLVECQVTNDILADHLGMNFIQRQLDA